MSEHAPPSPAPHPSTRRADPVLLLLWALVLAIPFQQVWTLPIVGERLQPPELVGLLVIGAGAWAVGRGRRPAGPSPIDAGVAAWWLGVTVAFVWFLLGHEEGRSVSTLEWLGTTYLIVLYGALRVLLGPTRVERLPAAFAVSAGVAAAIGLAGMALSHAGVDTRLAFPAARAFPYLGTAARAQAFTPAPAMLASVIGIGVFSLLVWRAPGRWRLGLGAILVAGLAATTSKGAVCLLVGALVTLAWRLPREARTGRGLVAVACAGLAVFYVAATHVFVVDAASTRPRAVYYPLLGAEPIGVTTVFGWRLAAYPTNYFVNRQTNLAAIRETWPRGVGPGQHGAFARREMDAGRRDRGMRWTDPHSTYLGVAAELGLAGVLGFMGFAAGIALALRRVAEGRRRLVFAAVAGGLAAVALDATATDVMNFRHLWVALAAVASWSAMPGGVRS